MADRIAVMNRGRIEQIGAPAELYERPATAFVANFLGASNLLDGELVASGSDVVSSSRLDGAHRARSRRSRSSGRERRGRASGCGPRRCI